MNSECSICFEIVRSNRVTDSKPNSGNPFITRCGHLFHENCIKDCLKSQSKCPQCQQQVLSSQLIRVYVNEPENSSKQKDEVIEQLKRQLNDLNEKAQLQYDLIGALNRQIKLEKELREKDSQQKPRLKLARNLIAPPNLNVQQNVYSPTVPNQFSFPSCSSANNSVFPFTSEKTTSRTALAKPLFSFGGTNTTESLGACSSSATATTKRSDTFGANNFAFPTTTQSQLFSSFSSLATASKSTFTFPSQSCFTFPPSSQPRNQLVDSATGTSSSQTGNIFSPTTTEAILSRDSRRRRLSVKAKPSSSNDNLTAWCPTGNAPSRNLTFSPNCSTFGGSATTSTTQNVAIRDSASNAQSESSSDVAVKLEKSPPML